MKIENGMLSHIHYLRGVAILVVVAAHALYDQFNWTSNSELEFTLGSIFSNGAVIFVFISGYLFQHFLPKYSYKNHLNKKLKNVITPYLFVSIPALVWAFTFGVNSAAEVHMPFSDTMFMQTIWYLSVGGGHVNWGLWFIPMIAIFFVLAPVLKQLSNHPAAYLVIVPLLVIAMLIHRQIYPHIAPLRDFVYFLPVYLIGMLASQFSTTIDPILNRHKYALLTLPIFLFLAQRFLSGSSLNIWSEKPFQVLDYNFDFLLLQKLALCFALTTWFQLKIPTYITKPLNYLADVSFSIFLIHIYFFHSIIVLLDYQVYPGTITLWFIRFTISILLSVIAIEATKKLLGQRSRLLIGS